MSKESALYLPKGALVGLPAAGTVGLFVDSTGTFKIIDESGNASLPVSSATSAAAGLLSAAGFASMSRVGPTLTDAAGATINPGSDKASVYILPAATLTQARTLIVGPTAGLTTQLVLIVVQPQSFAFTIQNDLSSVLFTAASSAQAIAYQLYLSGGHFTANAALFVNN